MSRILLTGIATLDIINTVEHYPQEDEELRALVQRISLGGNASNSASVLAQLGQQCELVAVVAEEPDGEQIIQALHAANVGTDYVSRQQGKSPVSYITLNETTGSRTIVHYRNLAELAFHHFQKIPVHEFDALHFEARNCAELEKMLRFVREQCVDQTVFLEIEKQRGDWDMLSLLPYVDVVMFSKAYVQSIEPNSANPRRFLQQVQRDYPEKILTCTWGATGAYALDVQGDQHFVAAPQVKVVDSIGAGDTFNAGLIHNLCSHATVPEALQFALELASHKVTQVGFDFSSADLRI
ncbi:MAG: PfkB family carbohydrate kinase [bacterium]